MGKPLREQRPPVELDQPLFDHAAHEVRDVHLVHAVPEPAFKPVAVQQGQEKLKVFLLAVVGGGRQEKEVPGEPRQKLAQLVAFGVPHLAPEEGGRHFVGFVYHHQVPPALRSCQLRLYGFVPGGLVQAGDHQVVF
ncbi:hypothetical protein HRbin30_01842 [bacterium HR30]|nr:hypothetical protein HRbin30_01842 [bacterium HR30]